MTNTDTDFDVEGVNAANTIALNKMVLTSISDNPLTRVLNLDEVSLDQIKKYLRSLHTQLWGHFSIFSTDGLEMAARFLQSELNSLYAYIGNNSN